MLLGSTLCAQTSERRSDISFTQPRRGADNASCLSRDTVGMKKTLLACCAALAAFSPSASACGAEGYVAHEWGTFTSVQGADGVQMPWNPLNVEDLPGFVYSLDRPGLGRRTVAYSLFSKTAFTARQRMETPVIYFYANEKRTVDVAVDFPGGTMTEWYPQARFADELTTGAAAKKPMQKRDNLRWQKVAIEPQREGANPSQPLTIEKKANHYYAARETDAALVTTDVGGTREAEKFLFYRGVGNFVAPLTVKVESQAGDRLVLQNTGSEPLGPLYVCEVRDGHGAYSVLEPLAPGESRSVQVRAAAAGDTLEVFRKALGTELQKTLAAQGLYEREAAAMVKTWDSSWFGEAGIRVLYTLPRQWTDRTLPLRIDPAPRELQRVMVGRAEIITPAMEAALESEITRYISGREAAKAEAIANTKQLEMGRFAEAVMRRLITQGKRSREFTAGSWDLLQASR